MKMKSATVAGITDHYHRLSTVCDLMIRDPTSEAWVVPEVGLERETVQVVKLKYWCDWVCEK